MPHYLLAMMMVVDKVILVNNIAIHTRLINNKNKKKKKKNIQSQAVGPNAARAMMSDHAASTHVHFACENCQHHVHDHQFFFDMTYKNSSIDKKSCARHFPQTHT